MTYKSKYRGRAKFMGFDGIDISSRKGSRRLSLKGSRKASRKGSRKMACSAGQVMVKGYKRADGVRVKRHCSKVGKRRSGSRRRGGRSRSRK